VEIAIALSVITQLFKDFNELVGSLAELDEFQAVMEHKSDGLEGNGSLTPGFVEVNPETHRKPLGDLATPPIYHGGGCRRAGAFLRLRFFKGF
jgi:hypothetical protein